MVLLSSAMGYIPGGGCHMVIFPSGQVLLWDFFRGEGLPYGIIFPGEQSAMAIAPSS